jgi:hypothetical protein
VKRSFPNALLLKARDPATPSIGLEVRFEVKDRAEPRALLEMPGSSTTMAFRLSQVPCRWSFTLGTLTTFAHTGFIPGANWHRCWPVQSHSPPSVTTTQAYTGSTLSRM